MNWSLAATALWASGSNALQHPPIGSHIDEAYAANPSDPVTVALKKQYFKREHAKPFTVADAGPIGFIVGVTSDPSMVEKITQQQISPNGDGLTVVMDREMEHHVVTLIRIPPNVGFSYEINLGSSSGTVPLTSRQIIDRQENDRIVADTITIRPDQLTQEGEVALTLTVVSSDGRETQIVKPLFVY